MGRVRTFLREFHPIIHSLLVGTIFVRAASSMSMPFLFIYLSRTTDMDLATIGLTVGAGSLAGTVGGFVGGTLSDMFGRRKVLLGALYVWTFVFLGFAYGSGTLFFIFLSMLGGLCRSFYEPVSQALMADLTTPEKRYRVFALRYTAINIGVAIGPIVGAILATRDGALPFLMTAIIYTIYVISLQVLLNRFGIRQIEGQKKEQITFGGAWNVVVSDVAFRFFIVGGALGAIGYSQMSGSLSKFVEMTVPNGVALFSILMSVNAVVVVLMQLPLTRWGEKRSPLQSILAGNIMYVIGDVGFAFADNWTLFIIAMVFFTFGEILTFTASDVFIDRLAPTHMRGTYYGAKSFSNLGHFIGPWMGGMVLASYGGTPLFLLVAAISMSSTLFFWGGQRQYQRVTGQELKAVRSDQPAV